MENTTNTTTGQNTDTTNTNATEGGLAGLLGNLNVTDMFKQYGGVATKALGSLSTTQKVIGGAVLLLGARYLSKKVKTGGFNPKAKK